MRITFLGTIILPIEILLPIEVQCIFIANKILWKQGAFCSVGHILVWFGLWKTML